MELSQLILSSKSEESCEKKNRHLIPLTLIGTWVLCTGSISIVAITTSTLYFYTYFKKWNPFQWPREKWIRNRMKIDFSKYLFSWYSTLWENEFLTCLCPKVGHINNVIHKEIISISKCKMGLSESPYFINIRRLSYPKRCTKVSYLF